MPEILKVTCDREPRVGIAAFERPAQGRPEVWQLLVELIQDLVTTRVGQDVPGCLGKSPEVGRMPVAHEPLLTR